MHCTATRSITSGRLSASMTIWARGPSRGASTCSTRAPSVVNPGAGGMARAWSSSAAAVPPAVGLLLLGASGLGESTAAMPAAAEEDEGRCHR